jgi:hypothetical protein
VQTGLRLERLPAQDMLDVLHYLFESDAVGQEEEQEAKHRLRSILYTELYERTYTWQGGGRGSNANGREFGTQEVNDSGTPQLTHKPFTPATPHDASSARPFGTVLDAPLG